MDWVRGAIHGNGESGEIDRKGLSRGQFLSNSRSLDRDLEAKPEGNDVPPAFGTDKRPPSGGQFRSGYAGIESPRAHRAD
ncbi:hypothetical protein GCM10010987_74550 [Bradyrhizobium guangdongense]|uniref:Uncharacterized protein n=1 Tax=Bradyrhizobium guangdongense TaxID=1325090 RepID=A0AA88BD99_9BRAD|nr:hypothetical protein GCM10010987_74550 [Bradyrhizobium guangdongense]